MFLIDKISLATLNYPKSPYFVSEKFDSISPKISPLSTYIEQKFRLQGLLIPIKDFGPHGLLITRYKDLITQHYILKVGSHNLLPKYVLMTCTSRISIFNTLLSNMITSLSFAKHPMHHKSLVSKGYKEGVTYDSCAITYLAR